MKVKILILVLMLAGCATTQGCIVAGIGLGVGAWKYGSAQQKEAYGKYRNQAEELNLEREKLDIEQKPVMTYEEWDEGET